VPIYEYQSLEDGQTISLLRPMSDADKPVDDPDGRGRTFVRRQSTFAVTGHAAAGSSSALPHKHGGGCACGNPHGPCAS
jgi:hypothetical protein